MTVCIGAICEDGKAAVVAADKMVVFGAPMNLETEPKTLKKITKLTEECVVAFSGGVADGEELVSDAVRMIAASNAKSVSSIAGAVKSAYVALKTKRVEEGILRPLLGANFAQFQTLVAQSSGSQILQQVMALLMQHNLQLDVLVAGVDESGSHLFVATNPGVLLPTDTTGFAAIGTGGLHAGVSLSLAQHNGAASLVDTIHNVYEAKKASEVAPGVGKITDMAIVRDGHTWFADSELFEGLDRLRKEKPTLSDPEQKELQKVYNEWIKRSESK